jgi:hypothetical protein
MNIRWSALRSVGNLPVMKVTLVGPFLPFVSELVDHLSSLPGTSAGLGIEWPYPKFTSLYFFYYGATVLGVASFLYLLFCPPLVKKYPGYADYLAKEASVPQAAGVSDEVQKRMRTEYNQADLASHRLRAAVFAMYCLGFVLVFVPPMHRFYDVSSKLIMKFIL